MKDQPGRRPGPIEFHEGIGSIAASAVQREDNRTVRPGAGLVETVVPVLGGARSVRVNGLRAGGIGEFPWPLGELNREPPGARVLRQAAGQQPGLQDARMLQHQLIVVRAVRMLEDGEAQGRRDGLNGRCSRRR